MDIKWNLESLYNGFDSAEFKADFDALNKGIDTLKQFNLTDDFKQTATTYIENANHALKYLFPLYSYSHLRITVDSTDTDALNYIDKLSKLESELTAPEVKFQQWLTKFDNHSLENLHTELLKKHAFYLKELKEKAHYALSEKEEVLLAKLRSVGANAWSQLQSQQTGDLEVEFELDGKTEPITLSMLRNLSNHADKDVRKRAYDAELDAYKHIEEAVAASLNAIKGDVIITSEMRGFKSALEQSVKTSRLDMASLDAMIEAMNEALPTFRKYYKRKAEILGYKQGLPFYEIGAPINHVNLNYTYEEAQNFVLENFGSFSDELKALAQTAFDNEWIDVFPRKGKRGGAFCAPIVGKNQSRVMLNFDGSFDQVSTMAHELGHAYHNSQLYDESFLNADYPMPLAETASIFCETIITNAAVKKATPDEAIYILEKSIMGSGQVIVDILSRFLFENSLFEARKDGPVPVAKLKEFMLDAQNKTYGDGLDKDFRHPYMWACKPHYYSADFNYYNYPYAFGQLFALGLYAIYEKGSDTFLNDYNNLLKATTQMNAKDVAKTMGIDISKKDFWKSSLSIIERQIEEFLALTK